MNIFKKTNKETNKLPMTGKVRKGFHTYCAIVLCMALVGAMTMTAFAAGGDPLSVINNLSDFIFGLIRAIGLILLGFGIVQVGLSLKSHDPSQRAHSRRWCHHHICEGNPEPYHGLKQKYPKGTYPAKWVCPFPIKEVYLFE